VEGQREGISKAKGEGKYKGRALAPRLRVSGAALFKRTRESIAAQLGVSVRNVYRVLRLAP
jgi:hypothetical protein